jgi:hypothetical protein
VKLEIDKAFAMVEKFMSEEEDLHRLLDLFDSPVEYVRPLASLVRNSSVAGVLKKKDHHQGYKVDLVGGGHMIFQ